MIETRHLPPGESTNTRGPCELCYHGFANYTIDHIKMCAGCANTYIELEMTL
jgi:hypothetical protein